MTLLYAGVTAGCLLHPAPLRFGVGDGAATGLGDGGEGGQAADFVLQPVVAGPSGRGGRDRGWGST